MKIIEKAKMPDGTTIQLEDWSEHNTEEYPNLYGLGIGAYPIAKNTGKYRLIESRNEFRLSIAMNNYTGYTNRDLKTDFKMLKSGEKKLEDLSVRFWNGDKDKWYLGMDVKYGGW